MLHACQPPLTVQNWAQIDTQCASPACDKLRGGAGSQMEWLPTIVGQNSSPLIIPQDECRSCNGNAPRECGKGDPE